MARRNDATGHTRGAGTYSRSYATMAKPKLDPTTARDIYGAVDLVGYRNDGMAAPVSEGKRSKSADKDD